MRSFAIPIFVNAFSTVFLFSMVDNAFSAVIRHHHHNHHNHIRPTYINDLKNMGYPSLPSVSSHVFPHDKSTDNFLMLNDAYLKDGWQSTLEVANAQMEVEAEGEGSPAPESMREGLLEHTINTAGPSSHSTHTHPQNVEMHHNHPHGHHRHHSDHHGKDGQDVTEYYHNTQRPRISINAQHRSRPSYHPLDPEFPSHSFQPAFLHHKACQLVKKVHGGLASRLSSYASTIHDGVIRLVNFHMAMFGVELRRTELPFEEEDYSLMLIPDNLD